jgi:hypothetical protein
MASYFLGKLLDRAARASASNQQPSPYGAQAQQNYGQPPTMQYPPSHNSRPNQTQTSFYGPPSQHSHGAAPALRPFQGYDPANPTAPAQSYPQTPHSPDFWGKLITPQQTASPLLIAYVTALYKFLDQAVAPSNQGGLSPEKIGVLGEMQGYHGDESLCASPPSHCLA